MATISGDPINGPNLSWTSAVPESAMNQCRHCGKESRAAFLRNLELREKEAEELAGLVLDWLDTAFKRIDLGPAELVMAYGNALNALRMVETEGKVPEIRPFREGLEAVTAPYQEMARELFNKTMREIIRRLLDGRLTYAEGSHGLELLHLCDGAVGYDCVCEAIDSVADEMRAEKSRVELCDIDLSDLDFSETGDSNAE